MSERIALKPAAVIGKLGGYRGDAYHVRLSEPVVGKKRTVDRAGYEKVPTSDVIVSAISDTYSTETMIFPANPAGAALSFVGIVAIHEYDHQAALAALGFEITD